MYCLHWDKPVTPPGLRTFSQGREAFRTSGDGVTDGRWQWWRGTWVRRGPDESRKARKRFGRMERAIRTLCFFLPRASTITSPVGGSEGGAGREEEEGAGEEGTGEEGRDGGGAGHGEGETRGGESRDAIAEGVNEEEDEDPDGLSSGGGVSGAEALQKSKRHQFSLFTSKLLT